MNKEKILKKFGKKEYQINGDTFVMGIHHLLGDHIAQRFKGYDIVLDACCGAGFMSIALTKYVNRVIVVDINPKYLEQAENNAKIASVHSKINFIPGDILNEKVLNKIPKIDGAFLDPDWSEFGKPKLIHTTKLSNTQPPADKLFAKINIRTKNIALRLPREIDLSELKVLPPHELEKIYLDDDFKFYCAYFGKLVKKIRNTEFRVFTER
jgi:16S rRNA G966 N2-methylase RsmD